MARQHGSESSAGATNASTRLPHAFAPAQGQLRPQVARDDGCSLGSAGTAQARCRLGRRSKERVSERLQEW